MLESWSQYTLILTKINQQLTHEYKFENLGLSTASSLVKINQEYTKITEASILAFAVYMHNKHKRERFAGCI